MKLPEIAIAWGTINQANLIETIEAAGRHGFPTISATPGIYHEALAMGFDAAALRRRLADAGVRVRVVEGIATGLPGQPSEPIAYRGRLLKRYDTAACLDVAEALGAPMVSAALQGDPVSVAQIAEAAVTVARRAAERGIALTVEFVPGSSVPDIATALAVVEATGEANCDMMLDTWHLVRSGGSAADIRALPPGVIGSFQLADRIEPPPGTPYVPMSGRYLPGEGELPLADMVEAALANNPGLTLELEVFSEELAAMTPDGVAERSAAAVRKWRERAGL